MKVLQNGCKWKLTWDGKLIETTIGGGLDDEGLDSFLLKNSNNKVFDKVSNIFYSKTMQDQVDDKIKEIIADRKNGAIEYAHKFQNEDGEPEVEMILKIPDSIGTTRLLSEINLENGKPLVTKFDQDVWKSDKIKAYSGTEPVLNILDQNMTKFALDNHKTPEEMVKMEMESWPKLTETGTEVHKIFEDIFNDKTPIKLKSLSDDVFNNLVSQINIFKNSLKQKYPNCRFYTELGIKSKNLSPDMQEFLNNAGFTSINGVIDLLVVDENGNGHLYDYKVTRKSIAPDSEDINTWWKTTGNKAIQTYHLWPSTKKLAAEYQLELYKNMLKAYGINVVDTNIAPVKIDFEYNNPNNPFEVTRVKNIHVPKESEIIKNPAKWNGGEHAKRIKKMFTDAATIDPDEVVNLSKVWDNFFPQNSIISKRETERANVDFYKKDDSYVHKVLPGERYYGEPDHQYRLSFKGINSKYVYCDESDLDTKLTEYINALATSRADMSTNIAEAIENVKSGSDESELFNLVGEKQQNFFRTAIEKYLRPEWQFVPNSAMNSLGLLIFKNGNRCEIVTLTDKALRVTQNLGEGKSILGKTVDDKHINSREILPAMQGNMELIKAMIYISQHEDVFEGLKITGIKVLNPKNGTEMNALLSQLIDNYNKLVEENSASGAKRISQRFFASDFESFVKNAEDYVNGLEQLLENGGSGTNDNYYSAEWFLNAIDLFKKHYGNQMDFNSGYQNTAVWNAYQKLYDGYLLAKGYKTHEETDKEDVISGKFYELNGLLISSPQLSSSANIRELGQAIDDYAMEVRNRCFQMGMPFNLALRKFYKKHGTGAKVFDIFYTDKENLILKDPDSPEFSGDPEAKEVLNLFLRTLAKLRDPKIETEEDYERAKQREDYYAIPLLEGTFTRQTKNIGFFKAIKNKFKENWTTTKNLFMGEEVEYGMDTYVTENQEVYNKLKYDNMLARQDRLVKYGGAGMMETDLELIMNASLVAFNRSNVSRDVLPVITALKMGLEYRDAHGSFENKGKRQDMANIRKRFDQIVKSKLYGESIVPEKAQGLLKFINLIKSFFTTLTLSLNNRSFLRETLSGIYNGVSRAGVKMYPGVDEKHYIEGLTYVMQECPKNFSGVSLLQQLNAVYGMANQSLNQLQGYKVNWAHISHWGKDTTFLTASSPDFLHRMAILVAKMKSDGCFDAYSLDENGLLKYDFKKDKRFEHFVKGETTNENYLKEKSLYLTMIDEFNKTGFTNPDGTKLNAENMDALPQAYTRIEGQSIKNFADLLYGHYDDESKSLLCDTFLGSIFLQYKTFLTAKLEQITMTKGIYNTEQLKQQFDKDGNPLYVKYYWDENNKPHKDTILQSEYDTLSDEEKKTCRLLFAYEGSPMQGIFQESLNVYKSLLTMNPEKIKKVWSDPTTRAMFMLQLHDLWFLGLMTFLVTYIFGTMEDVNNPLSQRAVYSAMRKAGPVESLAYNVLAGSMADFSLPNILGSIADKPPVISAITKFATTSMNLITGDSSVTNWLTRNIGAIRDLEGLTNMIDE